MELEAWLTLAVVVATVYLLASERASPPFVLLAGVTALLVAGVVDAEQAFAGFSNPAPLTVAALYVLASAAEKTHLLDSLASRLLGDGSARGGAGALARVLVPAAGASAFLNNTPIVAMVAPAVVAWARRTGASASRYLIPVSFAAILGGVVTLIGTSTNLVVSGLLEESGHRPLGLFEIGKVGLPFAVAGLALLVFAAPRLLPARTTPAEALDADVREFTVEMAVEEGSPLAGRSVVQAGLRNLEGVYLVAIERDGYELAPVGPDEVLQEGDRLTFAGNVERVLDLQQRPGLTSSEQRHFADVARPARRRLFEAVLAPGSTLVGSTLKRSGFRARHGAAVLAIHRADQRLPGKLGDLTLRGGDVLLLVGPPDFRRRADRRDFLVVAPLGGDPPRREKAPLVGLVLAGLLVLAGTGTLDILPAALLAAFALVGLGVLSPTEARDAVDLNVVLVIAASFGLGAALTTSGLAETIASLLIEPLGSFGDVGLLIGVLLATSLLTEVVTNNAAAVLMFPIALATADAAGLDPRPFAIVIALGASSSFLTPIGYQTNTMVYGMGGYHFGDFARVGLPLTVVMVIVAALVVPLAWPLR
ncbi:MAG: SLC13 family permease [Thermoleophilia bacterium]|nr:SLC13 family permease [Thermoleophilia bacterium]